MPLQTRLLMTPLSGGASVSLHGCEGEINLIVAIDDKFRRPGAKQAGYQKLGSDCPESTLRIWSGLASKEEGAALVLALNALITKKVSVTYKEYTSLPCYIRGFQVDRLGATRGSIITGTTPSLYRLNGTIKLDHAP